MRASKEHVENLNAADVPPKKREDSLKALGLESDISAAYVAANAGTPEGAARMKEELGAFSSKLKKSYMKLSLTKHPDKGGDPTEFSKISEANKTLAEMTAALRATLD